MMFVNLHTLPADQSLYTLTLTWDPAGTPQTEMYAEELDVIAPAGAGVATVLSVAAPMIASDYEPGARVVAIADQSDGCMIATDVDGDLAQGATLPQS